MSDFQLRTDSIEIEGKVVYVWADQPFPGEPQTYKWHVVVQLKSGDQHLTTVDGKINRFDWIECQVTPVSPYRGQPHAGRLLGDLLGQKVRISGSWGDVTEAGVSLSTLVWPVAWILVDRGITPIIEEHGFSQAIRDVDIYAFSDDSNSLLEPVPPHHREDRHMEISVPFPFRPQADSTPEHTECVDREDKEQMIYGFRATSAPAFPLHAHRQHNISVVAGAEGDLLRVTIDTGLPSAGKGFYYAKLTLSYEEPFAKMCLPDICLTDPGLSCQLTDEIRLSYVWPKLSSALSGDLLLGPAGPNGVLGRLLGALRAPQHYDHMVMFVEDDGCSIRHCTASDERIAQEEYYTATVTVNTPIFSGSKKLPLAGIRSDVLRYAWPGTITQTIGEVGFTGRNRSNPQFGFAARYPEVSAAEAGAPPLLRQLVPSERAKRTAFHDPEAAGTAKREKNGNKRASYSLARLQLAPAFRPEIDAVTGRPIGWIYPILVRPHPFVAGRAREALRVVVTEAKKISAHYRFFGYSDSSIAANSAFNAPVGGWSADEGINWAAGTVAAVCSTFVWAAVQAANLRLIATGKPRIELEGESELEDGRLASGVDGLYQYTLDERADAAQALYDFTHERVVREVDKLLVDLPWYGDLIIHGVPGVSGTIDGAKEFLASVVANQLCNIFAKDVPNDLTTTWNNPGTGTAVSPDDTMLRWDVHAPLTAPPPPIAPNKINVYGNAMQVLIPEAGWLHTPIYRIRESIGKGTLHGTVVRLAPGEPALTDVIGATVRFGCQSTTNQIDVRDHVGFEFVDVKAGRYHLQASDFVTDPATNIGVEWKSKQHDVTLNDGDDLSGIVLELFPPPGLARNIEIRSHHDIVDRVVVGKDRWGHPDLDGAIHLAFDPRDVAAVPKEQQNTRLNDEWDQTTPEVGSGVHVRVIIKARLRTIPPPTPTPFDGAVICDIKIVFFDSGEGETNATIEENNIVLELGETFTKLYNEVSSDTVPERASGTVTITNLVAALP